MSASVLADSNERQPCDWVMSCAALMSSLTEFSLPENLFSTLAFQ